MARVEAGGDVSVQVVMGDPLAATTIHVYRDMLARAGVAGAEAARPPQAEPRTRSAFHVAVAADGQVLGVAQTRIGPLDRLVLGPRIDPDARLAGPVCEAPWIAVVPEAADAGVTELLYRSVYCFARRHDASSLATVVDPLTLELFREHYGIRFRPLGPVRSVDGVDSVAVGEELHLLEAELRARRPDFLAFLVAPFTSAERVCFGL